MQRRKKGFPHFMLKEIHEEPRAVRDTLSSVLSSDIETFFVENEFDTINIVACGTAMHAGLIGKYMTEKLARIPVNVYIASEFRYQDPILGKRDLVILFHSPEKRRILWQRCAWQKNAVRGHLP